MVGRTPSPRRVERQTETIRTKMAPLPQQTPSRKRHLSFVSPFPPAKNPKSTSANRSPPPSRSNTQQGAIDRMLSILADAGCTLINPSGPPCLPSEPHTLRSHLNRIFSSSPTAHALRSDFLTGFSAYIQSPSNLRRVLVSSHQDGFGTARNESLVRHLLLVPAIQLDLQNLLLEKLPEYFDEIGEGSLSLEDDLSRLIVNQFRWLDFLVDPNAFTDKLMQVLSVCPLYLKKEIIGSLPEIVGDHNHKNVVHSLEQMLKEDSTIILPVLDSFSNLRLDDTLQEQVITVALSCIKTVELEHMPHLLRFLLLSATPSNARRIISKIRERLTFVRMSNSSATQHSKLKGKSPVGSTEASILEALKSSLLFKNMLCQEILKELSSIERAEDLKVIDIWLLVLMHMNGESMQKSVEKILKKKIIENCIQKVLFDQCIFGNSEFVQEYFPSFLALSAYLLACKEEKAREFGIHIYICLFEEFSDTYSRQEILGALVAHVGSGVSSEIKSALDTMTLLASKHAQEFIRVSAHINGILDYLEDFDIENLHKVYEVFSHLAFSARSNGNYFESSAANELLMIVKKQVSHPDLKYKKMGIIGTLKIVSSLGDANNVSGSPSQKSNWEEALELLRMCLDSCKQFCLPLILFYDELTAMLEYKILQPPILEWIGKQAGDFESRFLSDLEGGQLPNKDSFCGLDGELWMNLDGDISPICLSILPLAVSSLQSASSLQNLPANFVLLAVVERLTNGGSLSGIDALLGCPLLLPSSRYYSRLGWESLTTKQKQIACLSLYYAINWIRELLNAFCTQVTGKYECTSQATKKDLVAKLLKRLSNLIFLESLLDSCIERHSLTLPELHLYIEHSGTLPHYHNKVLHEEIKDELKRKNDNISLKKRTHKSLSKASVNSDANGKLQQPTIVDVLRKAGAATSQVVSSGSCSNQSPKEQTFDSSSQDKLIEPPLLSGNSFAKALETQRFKFRPLLVQSLSFLKFSELPLCQYLYYDLHCKLDYFTSLGKQLSARCLSASAAAGYTQMGMEEFLSEIRLLFPYLRRHFDSAVSVLKDGQENCEEHWQVHSVSAGNLDTANLVYSKSSSSTFVFKEVLHCFKKMLNLRGIQTDKSVLLDLLEAFQPSKTSENVFTDKQSMLSPGTIEYLYLGAASFIEEVLDTACSFSFMLASECLLTLESIANSIQSLHKLLEKNGRNVQMISAHKILPIICTRLGISAQKLLRHNWDDKNLNNGWKNKGEIVQKILQIYLENSKSTSELLVDLACTVLPQVSSPVATVEEDHHSFPALCNATLVVWYKEMHEANLTILSKLVKEISPLMKPRAVFQQDTIDKHMTEIRRSVSVLVSLVHMCRTYDKVNLHAMAVKYTRKYVDSFLKVLDFLQAHFETHNECIVQLITELQKATRTIQVICSEAKRLKQTAITRNIPFTKRSMERLLFRVKALLHATSAGNNFWMGNLKHKNLMGEVVSSQAYIDGQNEQECANEDPMEPINEDQVGEEAVDDDQAVSEDAEAE